MKARRRNVNDFSHSFSRIMPKNVASRIFCGHCKEFVGKSTFYKHKRRYYNASVRTWQQPRPVAMQRKSGISNTLPMDLSFDDDFLETKAKNHKGE